ncbi:MAG: hypothetical protein FWG90_05340 [Oscillospiraceae bacterium]|nr:hypothetical protein [Oscillospiraceae bacterium]
MRKIEVLLNEEKIRAEGKYELEKIYAELDKSFINKAGMQKSLGADGTVIYFVSIMKDENHYAKIMLAIKEYVKEKWFTDNVLKYLYGDTYGSNNPNDYSIEDVLEEWEVGKSVLV